MAQASMENDQPPKPQSPGGAKSALASLQEAGRYLHLGFEFLGAIIFFVGVGFFVDRWLGTLPLFTLVGVALAFVGIMTQVILFSNKESMEVERRRSEESET